MDHRVWTMAIEGAEELREACEQLDLPVSAAAAEFLHRTMAPLLPESENEFVTLDQRQQRKIGAQCKAVRERMVDELGARKFLSLSAAGAVLYEPPEPLFGIDVAGKFPVAEHDISEAGKCLGLGRATAAVFHLMRVTEVGALALTRCLRMPDPSRPSERNLGVRLSGLKKEIDTRWNAVARMSGDGAFFENVYASLDARKNPWRNATAHPERTYTVEEATVIFHATKELLQEVASRCDENGDPRV